MGLRNINYEKAFEPVTVHELKSFLDKLNDEDIQLFVGVGDTLSRLVDIHTMKPPWLSKGKVICFVDTTYLEESCEIIGEKKNDE